MPQQPGLTPNKKVVGDPGGFSTWRKNNQYKANGLSLSLCGPGTSSGKGLLGALKVALGGGRRKFLV
jgi:hypothetical protein